jgi:enamine deaminase RidA (YjgF/YER057c/UK114 family)
LKRRTVPAGTPWGDRVGYSRAISVGGFVSVSGTAASDEKGRVVGDGDAYEQTKYILKKIGRALTELDASPEDVVRTRIYTTDISKWKEIGKAHREFFGETKPATAMVEVSGLIDPRMMVEIEVDAIVG